MFRRFLKSDIPFDHDDAQRLLPAMIACLSCFVALLLAVAVSLTDAIGQQSEDVIGNLQVELPRARANDTAYLETVTNALKRTEGVKEATTLGVAQMESLLKPWLGDDFALGDLPVPVIIEVKTAVSGEETKVNLVQLRSTLSKIDTNITLSDRGPWIGHLAQAMALLQALVLLIALLLMLCVVAMMVLVARTSLRLHFKTVSLLHMFGATDEYILSQFQRHNAVLAARGALVGVIAAGLVFAASVLASVRWQSPLLPSIEVTPMHAMLFLLLPVFTGVIAWATTRVTVQSMLEHMR